jgi:hypothetical protein
MVRIRKIGRENSKKILRKSPDYAKVINERHLNRVKGLLKDAGDVVCGGTVDPSVNYMAPTLGEFEVTDVTHISSSQCKLGRSHHERRNFRSSVTYNTHK